MKSAEHKECAGDEMRHVNTLFVNKSGSDNVTEGQKSETDPKFGL
jgi:hypothetical protein